MKKESITIVSEGTVTGEEHTREQAEILVVDDSASVRNVITKALNEEFIVHEAGNGREAWEILKQNNKISVVYSDLFMPEINGLQLLQMLRGIDDERMVKMPFIIITGNEDKEASKRAAYNMGATDFIPKPFDVFELLSKTRSYAELSLKVDQLKDQANYDVTTDLYNTKGLNERGQEILAFALRHRMEFCLTYAEIVNLKDIYNDHGRDIAEQVVKCVAANIIKAKREEDIAARVSSSRFAILMPMTSFLKSYVAINRLHSKINSIVFNLNGENFKIKLAVGVTSGGLDKKLNTFDDVKTQAELSLKNAIMSEDGKEAAPDVAAITRLSSKTGDANRGELWEAFEQILNENFSNITGDQIRMLKPTLLRFMSYIAERENEISNVQKMEKSA